jgi:hypothetical protein
MIAKTSTFAIFVLAFGLALTAPLVAAQDSSMHGQDNEFGSVRAPYAVTMNGQRAVAEAHVFVKNMYEDTNSRYFMFAASVENSPALDLTQPTIIRTDTNKALPCAKGLEGDSKTSFRCSVDLKDMPPTGTEILIRTTVGSSKLGTFQVGFPVIAFTYDWNKVKMSNNLEAELYGYSQVNVQKATGSESSGISGLGNKVPGVGVLGVIGVGVAAAVIVGLARRR